MFIRRAENPRDPWSGHMAFPGGRMDPVDVTPLDAAIRETYEEVALHVHKTELLGELSPVPAHTQGRPIPLVIHPFVFGLTRSQLTIQPDQREVQEVLWIPLSFFLAPQNRSTLRMYDRVLPCYRYTPTVGASLPTEPNENNEPRIIWGLTLGMLDELLQRITAYTSRRA